MNNLVVERIYPNDRRVKPQTIAHHVARYKFATATLAKKNALALDMACGTGYGTEILRKAGFKAIGVDIAYEAIDFARRQYVANEYIRQSAVEFNYGKYDLVTFFEALEHLSFGEGVTVLEAISHSLKPDGMFLMSIPRDINKKYNKFHASKWNCKLLYLMLKALFKHAQILGQDWDTAEITDIDVTNNDFYIGLCSNG